MHDLNILVVDDSPQNTFLVSEILQAAGYQAKTTSSGKQALEIVAQGNIGLILLDVMMPEMNGFEVCQRLKSDPLTANIPVIFLSSLDDSQNIVDGLKIGGVDYVGKPFNTHELLARVKTHFTMKIQQEKLQTQYAEIERLQNILRKFVSNDTWLSIKADAETLTKTTPQFEKTTLMFTDIADFTSISEIIEPQKLIPFLTAYMTVLSEIIHKYEGQIDKFLGDGVFAFFTDAKMAHAAAIDIQRALLTFNKTQETQNNPQFLTRIGLATGDILQVILGFDDRLEHTLIGDRVNTAARLQAESPVGGIIMDHATYLAIEQDDTLIANSITLKGKIEKEQTYTIFPSSIQKVAAQNNTTPPVMA